MKILSKKSKKIKILVNFKNIGAGPSRNKGIKKAKGSYIAFIDADDTWKKNKLSVQIKFMKKNDYHFSFTSYEVINDKGKFISKKIVPRETNYRKLLLDCKIGLSTVMLKKKIITNYFKFADLKTKEDYVLWLKLSKKYRLASIDKVLTKWRKTENSLSSSTIQKISDGFRVYNKFLKINFFQSLIYLLFLSLNYLIKR